MGNLIDLIFQDAKSSSFMSLCPNRDFGIGGLILRARYIDHDDCSCDGILADGPLKSKRRATIDAPSLV
ncbi:MAG TPA: hypothetical protein DCS30_06135 [Rhizobiales bacterium]|nr:hypothetical protein [Hyphomicrobiales bacterium]